MNLVITGFAVNAQTAAAVPLRNRGLGSIGDGAAIPARVSASIRGSAITNAASEAPQSGREALPDTAPGENRKGAAEITAAAVEALFHRPLSNGRETCRSQIVATRAGCLPRTLLFYARVPRGRVVSVLQAHWQI